MNRFKRYDPARDIFVAILLVMLIRPALYLSAKRQYSETIQQEAFCTHELDKGILQTFETAQCQLEQTITLAHQKNKLTHIEPLEDLKGSLTTIKARYEHNSPGVLFLGPFSSISIVLKELEIERELKEIVAQLNTYLHDLSGKEKIKKTDLKIETCLKENQQLMKQFSIISPHVA